MQHWKNRMPIRGSLSVTIGDDEPLSAMPGCCRFRVTKGGATVADSGDDGVLELGPLSKQAKTEPEGDWRVHVRALRFSAEYQYQDGAWRLVEKSEGDEDIKQAYAAKRGV